MHHDIPTWDSLPKQERVILNHLLEKGSITAGEAQMVYRVRSLSRRITTLIDSGCRILKSEHRDLTGQRYRRYSLMGCPERLRPPFTARSYRHAA